MPRPDYKKWQDEKAIRQSVSEQFYNMTTGKKEVHKGFCDYFKSLTPQQQKTYQNYVKTSDFQQAVQYEYDQDEPKHGIRPAIRYETLWWPKPTTDEFKRMALYYNDELKNPSETASLFNLLNQICQNLLDFFSGLVEKYPRNEPIKNTALGAKQRLDPKVLFDEDISLENVNNFKSAIDGVKETAKAYITDDDKVLKDIQRNMNNALYTLDVTLTKFPPLTAPDSKVTLNDRKNHMNSFWDTLDSLRSGNRSDEWNAMEAALKRVKDLADNANAADFSRNGNTQLKHEMATAMDMLCRTTHSYIVHKLAQYGSDHGKDRQRLNIAKKIERYARYDLRQLGTMEELENRKEYFHDNASPEERDTALKKQYEHINAFAQSFLTIEQKADHPNRVSKEYTRLKTALTQLKEILTLKEEQSYTKKWYIAYGNQYETALNNVKYLTNVYLEHKQRSNDAKEYGLARMEKAIEMQNYFSHLDNASKCMEDRDYNKNHISQMINYKNDFPNSIVVRTEDEPVYYYKTRNEVKDPYEKFEAEQTEKFLKQEAENSRSKLKRAYFPQDKPAMDQKSFDQNTTGQKRKDAAENLRKIYAYERYRAAKNNLKDKLKFLMLDSDRELVKNFEMYHDNRIFDFSYVKNPIKENTLSVSFLQVMVDPVKSQNYILEQYPDNPAAVRLREDLRKRNLNSRRKNPTNKSQANNATGPKPESVATANTAQTNQSQVNKETGPKPESVATANTVQTNQSQVNKETGSKPESAAGTGTAQINQPQTHKETGPKMESAAGTGNNTMSTSDLQEKTGSQSKEGMKDTYNNSGSPLNKKSENLNSEEKAKENQNHINTFSQQKPPLNAKEIDEKKLRATQDKLVERFKRGSYTFPEDEALLERGGTVTSKYLTDKSQQQHQISVHYNNSDCNLPKEILATGDTKILKEFLKNPPKKLTKLDEKHLENRIEVMEHVDDLEKFYNGKDRKPVHNSEHDTREDLKNIELDRIQDTNNGCWSCAYSMLLKSRGVDVDQTLIRRYRPELSIKEASHLGDETIDIANSDDMNSIFDNGSIMTKLCPNTVMKKMDLFNADPDQLEKFVYDSLRKHAPVAYTNGGHWVTITSYDPSDGYCRAVDSASDFLTSDLNIHTLIDSGNTGTFVSLQDLDPLDKNITIGKNGLITCNVTESSKDAKPMNIANAPEGSGFAVKEGNLEIYYPTMQRDFNVDYETQKNAVQEMIREQQQTALEKDRLPQNEKEPAQTQDKQPQDMQWHYLYNKQEATNIANEKVQQSVDRANQNLEFADDLAKSAINQMLSSAPPEKYSQKQIDELAHNASYTNKTWLGFAQDVKEDHQSGKIKEIPQGNLLLLAYRNFLNVRYTHEDENASKEAIEQKIQTDFNKLVGYKGEVKLNLKQDNNLTRQNSKTAGDKTTNMVK